jgi:alpha-N-arabinofuranosidase
MRKALGPAALALIMAAGSAFGQAAKAAPKAVIEAGSVRTPISKYIYGQFIEHLGRCIYGGIWAEMVEDRKFFYPVGAKDSPWAAVGEARAIRMNPVLPYAGVQAPEIRLKGDGAPGGLVQKGLGVLAGKDYIGRIVLAADPGAVPVEVSLVWGDGPQDRQTVELRGLKGDYASLPLAFTAGAASDEARLEIVSRGKEAFRVGAVSLMPADNVEGFRPDVLALLKELDAPVYRWPGGNFVSGYDWRDGLGDRDRRPPRKNPAWLGVESNDVGLHEFLRFCELLGTEPYIAVNSGQGSESMAADEVEYVNGPVVSAMGRLRSAHGRPEPWKVRFWSIGNEMYGDWQLGHMPLSDYVLKHNRFANLMWIKDPSLQLIGVGAVGPWSEGMLKDAARSMSLMSEHFYVGSKPDLAAHVAQMPAEVKRIADAHRGYRRTIPALKEKAIPVALDEWNYWYGPHLYGELGTQYFLKDALGVAAGLHEFFRSTDVYFMANYAQTVNVIGAVKTSKTAATLDTTGVVLKLYRRRFGTIPVRVSGAFGPLDVAAAWKDAKKQVLTVAVVNPTKTAQRLPLAFKGFKPAKTVAKYIVTGADELACNVPGREPAVKITELPAVPMADSLSLPPLSVALYVIGVRS